MSLRWEGRRERMTIWLRWWRGADARKCIAMYDWSPKPGGLCVRAVAASVLYGWTRETVGRLRWI